MGFRPVNSEAVTKNIGAIANPEVKVVMPTKMAI